MLLRSLSLQHFRSHHTFQCEFTERATILIGPNGSGKSSILEAIHLFSIGKSIRALQTSEMISLGKELARVQVVAATETAGQATSQVKTVQVRTLPAKTARVTPSQADDFESGHKAGSSTKDKGNNDTNNEEIDDDDTGDDDEPERVELEAMITRGIVGGRKTSSKLWSVNGVRRAQRTAVGSLKSVLFRPEDMRLIEGSPARRREYLNAPLTQLYPEYMTAIDTYDKYLTRRNKLLLAVREGEQPRTVLTYWNEGLLKHGQIIQRHRQQFFTTLPLLHIALPFTATYQPSVISLERQKEYLEKEIAAGHTLIGPHKDDFVVFLPASWLPPGADEQSDVTQEFSVTIYGSRGQQRLAVLWLKLAEAAYLHMISGEKPLLLLDDILSELDEESRERIQQLAEEYQTILTTIDVAEAKKLFPTTPMRHLSLHRTPSTM